MVATPASRTKSALTTAAKVAGSALFLWLALHKLDSHEVARILGGADPGLLVLAVILLFLQVPLTGIRWGRVSAAIGEKLSFRDATAIGLVGYFFNLVLPSGIGGDGMRILLMSQKGTGLRLAATSVLVDRVATLLGLVVLIEAGAPYFWPFLPLPEQRYPILLIGLGTVGGFIVLMAWRRFGRLVPLLRSVRFLDDLGAGAERVFLRSRAGIPVLGLATTGQALTCLALWVLARALSIPASLEAILLVFPLVTLLIVLPISVSGWGIREGAMAYGLGLFGVAPELAVTLSLTFGVANIFAYLPGLGAWLLMRRAREARTAS